MLVKLSKEALKLSGKEITNILKETVPVRTGNFKKSIKAWAKIDYKTGQPYLEVGYLNKKEMKKRGVKYFVNPAWFEFGTKPHTIMTKEFKKTGKSSYQLKYKQKFGVVVKHPGIIGKNFLRNTVMNNIERIQSVQKDKLKQITDIMINKGAKFDILEDEEID